MYYVIWNDKATKEGVCVFDLYSENELATFLIEYGITNPKEVADHWYIQDEVEFLIIKGNPVGVKLNEV